MESNRMPATEILINVARLLDNALASAGIENARQEVIEAEKRRSARTALEHLEREDSLDRTA